jgi:cytidine deaminase
MSLEEMALASRERALAPYSGYRVGAAIETESGTVFTGVNIENASYGLTICAERVAVFSAINAGARQFVRIVVATDSTEPATPCGACRQVLWELCGDIPVTLVNPAGRQRTLRLSDLLPHAFDRRDLDAVQPPGE